MLAKPEEQDEVLLPVQEHLKAQVDGIAARSYAEGYAEGHAEGHAEGYAEGYAEVRTKALERERVLLHRLIALRFGAETEQQSHPLLVAIEDPERLVDVGTWLTECATGQELLERVRNAD